jgi:hypothetical protein
MESVMKKKLLVLLLTVLMIGLSFACHRSTPDFAKTELEDTQKALRGGVGFECKDIRALIPVDNNGKPMVVEGEKCTDNKAVINGWSRLCVPEGQCDTTKRLAEVNGAAEAFCAEWCSKKKCDSVYTQRSKCDSSHCDESADCKAKCDGPFRDSCYLQKAAPDYNCKCIERVNG